MTARTIPLREPYGPVLRQRGGPPPAGWTLLAVPCARCDGWVHEDNAWGRVGELLGPAEVGVNQHSGGGVAHKEPLSKKQRHEFRTMAANPDAVEDVIADSTDEAPASRRKVLDSIRPKKRASATKRRDPLTGKFSRPIQRCMNEIPSLLAALEDDRFGEYAHRFAADHREQVAYLVEAFGRVLGCLPQETSPNEATRSVSPLRVVDGASPLVNDTKGTA